MKTLAVVALATIIASPVLAQEAERALPSSPVGQQVVHSVRQPTLHPSVRNAYASAVHALTFAGGEPDSFIRSQLPRDAYTD